ncbi:MAG: protein kinase, partial [Fimbriimonadales bacterium]
RTEIGEFEVQQVLGAGGMGVVYQVVRDARHGGRQFALKTILPEFLNRREVVGRFESEGQVLAKFDHENIIKIDGIFTMYSEPPRPFILMELLHGYTLRYVMDQYEGLPTNDVCTVAIGVCNAFEEIHKSGVVHRDIKPENIFIQKRRKQTRVVLIDFGIMKLVLDPGAGQTRKSFIGSYSNASPEQLQGKEVTPRSDFYSLGAVLYEMLTGGVLFPGVRESHAIGAAHISRQPIPLQECAPHVPKEIAEIVMQALAKDPSARPKDAHAFRQPFVTVRNRLLRDKAQSAGQSTIERFLANPVGAERAPPVASNDGQTRALAAPHPDLGFTTAVSDAPHGGTQPDRSVGVGEPIAASAALAGVTRTAARPVAGGATFIGNGPLDPAPMEPDESAPWEAPGGLDAIPSQASPAPSPTPGTDATSSHDLPAPGSLPRLVTADSEGQGRLDLSLRRPLLPRVLAVIAVGSAVAVGALYARRSSEHHAGPSPEAVQVALSAPSDLASPAPLPHDVPVAQSPPPAAMTVNSPATVAAASAGSARVAEPQVSGRVPRASQPSRGTVPSPSKVPPAPSISPSGKPDCTKNYIVDSDGNKVFRPECFQTK